MAALTEVLAADCGYADIARNFDRNAAEQRRGQAITHLELELPDELAHKLLTRASATDADAAVLAIQLLSEAMDSLPLRPDPLEASFARSLADHAGGRYERFESMDDFLAALASEME